MVLVLSNRYYQAIDGLRVLFVSSHIVPNLLWFFYKPLMTLIRVKDGWLTDLQSSFCSTTTFYCITVEDVIPEKPLYLCSAIQSSVSRASESCIYSIWLIDWFYGNRWQTRYRKKSNRARNQRYNDDANQSQGRRLRSMPYIIHTS